MKQEGLVDHLTYDAYERRSGLVGILPRDTTPEAAAAGIAPELADLRDGTWSVTALDRRSLVAHRDGTLDMGGESVPLTATRTVRLGGGRMDPVLSLEIEIGHAGASGAAAIDALLAIEWSTMLLGGGHNPAAWIDVDGNRVPHDSSLVARGVTSFSAGNDQRAVAIETTIDPPVDLWIAPIETVSNSEGGFELVYQGSACLYVVPLRLAAGEHIALRITHAVAIANDARETEA